MAAVEVFTNQASTTVSSGGTAAPVSGTVETWTVASSASFPAASNSATPPTQFHVADEALISEIIAVTNVSGATWTVTRGAEGTTPVAHTSGFTIQQVVTAGFLGAVAALDTTASDIQPSPGTQAAGSAGLAADAKHVHGQPPVFAPTGLTGAVAASRYAGATASGHPTSGTYAAGDYTVDQTGSFWICTTGGSPGTWVQVIAGSVASGGDASLLIAPSGALAETFTRMMATSASGALTSGTVYVTAIPLTKGTSVGHITIVTGSATGVTHGWYVLLDSGYVVRAVSADNTTAWGSPGPVTLAMASPYTAPSAGPYYIGMCQVASSPSSVSFPANFATNTLQTSTSPVLYGSSSGGQTTPPSTGTTLATPNTSGVIPFYGYVTA